jgi:hypothetical protein
MTNKQTLQRLTSSGTTTAKKKKVNHHAVALAIRPLDIGHVLQSATSVAPCLAHYVLRDCFVMLYAMKKNKKKKQFALIVQKIPNRKMCPKSNSFQVGSYHFTASENRKVTVERL